MDGNPTLVECTTEFLNPHRRQNSSLRRAKFTIFYLTTLVVRTEDLKNSVCDLFGQKYRNFFKIGRENIFFFCLQDIFRISENASWIFTAPSSTPLI